VLTIASSLAAVEKSSLVISVGVVIGRVHGGQDDIGASTATKQASKNAHD
jgi:hypothetical protein